MNGVENRQNIDKLINLHMDRAYSIAFRMTNKEDAAADIAQNAFIKIMENSGKYNPAIDFERWLYAIIRNLYIDTLRRGKFETTADFEKMPDMKEDKIYLPENQAQKNYIQTDVQSALNELTPELRMAVIMVDMEGFSYEETAQALHWPLGTVCARLFRARGILRKKLNAVLQGGMV